MLLAILYKISVIKKKTIMCFRVVVVWGLINGWGLKICVYALHNFKQL